jgi:hypothetical protein
MKMKKEILDTFWNIYDEEGAIPALSWLETLKYYEDYCKDNIEDAMKDITSCINNMNINSNI